MTFGLTLLLCVLHACVCACMCVHVCVCACMCVIHVHVHVHIFQDDWFVITCLCTPVHLPHISKNNIPDVVDTVYLYCISYNFGTYMYYE